MASQREIDHLIRTIFEKGEGSVEGLRAIEALPQLGDSAVDAMIAAVKDPPKSNLHPLEVHESIGSAFYFLARTSSDRLIEQMERGEIERETVCFALRNARGENSLRALMNCLRDRNQYVRWASATSLVHRRCRRAIPLLVEMLKDRSSLVQCVIVFSMKDGKWLRRP